MAKYFKYIFLLTSSIFLLASCQEGRDAGDLFGQWQMTDSKYVSFSNSIVVFRSVIATPHSQRENSNVRDGEVYGTFEHVGDSLFIHCYSITDVTGTPEDIDLIENVFGLKPFGNIRFRIDALDDDQLLLSKDNQHWKLIKW